MSEQDFQDQLSDDVASELHPDDIDPEASADESDVPQVDADRDADLGEPDEPMTGEHPGPESVEDS